MALETVENLAAALLLILTVANMVRFKSRISRIETKIGTIQFESPDENSPEIKADVETEVQKVKSDVYILYLLMFLLCLVSILASPFYSKNLCTTLLTNNVYTLNMRLLKVVNGQKLALPNMIIEINGNADNPRTDMNGNSMVNYHQYYSRFPGCDCSVENTIDLILIDSSGHKYRHSQVLSTDWLLKHKTNPSILEIVVN